MADIDTALIALGRQFGVTRQPDDDSEAFIKRVNDAAQSYIAASKGTLLAPKAEPPRDLYAVALPKSVQAEFDALKTRVAAAEIIIGENNKAIVALRSDDSARISRAPDRPGISDVALPEHDERPGPTFVCEIPVGDEPLGWRDTDKIHERLGDLGVAISERWAEGKAKHGRKFQGWPMYHLQEELVDGIFYAMAAEHQLEAAIALLRRWDCDSRDNSLADDTAEYLASLDE